MSLSVGQDIGPTHRSPAQRTRVTRCIVPRTIQDPMGWAPQRILSAILAADCDLEPRTRKAHGREGSMAGFCLGCFAVYSG